MFDRLRGLLSGTASAEDKAPSEPFAVALLLLEMARADLAADDVERARIAEILARRYSMDAAAVQTLMNDAAREGEDAVSLFDYVKTLNAALDAAAKRELMELLWDVAYADGHLDHYEEHLLRKLADLLYIPQRDYIETKLAVAERGA